MLTTERHLLEFLHVLAHDGPAFVGICGLPGSGKTTLSLKLAQRLPYGVVIKSDDFCIPTQTRKHYLAQALQDGNAERLEYLAHPQDMSENPFADPLSWYDWKALTDCLIRIKNGHEVYRPFAWNQKTGECDRSVTYPALHRHSVCFVDSIYLFEESLPKLLKTKVMIEEEKASAVQQLHRRDAHRSDALYLAYKSRLSELYCEPYLEARRPFMNFILPARGMSKT